MTGPDDQQYRDQPQDDRPTGESSETEQAPGATPAGGASPAGAHPDGGATLADPSGDEPTTVVPQDQLSDAGSGGTATPADNASFSADRGYPADQSYPADQNYPADQSYPADQGFSGDATRTQMLPESPAGAGYQSAPAYSQAPVAEDPNRQSAYGANPYGGAGAGQSATGYQQQPSQYPPQQSGGYQPADSGQGFFAQQQPQVQLEPAKNRIAQNFGGGLIGLVLTLGAAALFGLLAAKLNMVGGPANGDLGGPSTMQELAYYGLIAVAAVPALLAGFAPATAWVPGVVIVVAALTGRFSTSFSSKMVEWSNDLFGTPGMASFVNAVGIPLGFALLFAGVGATWARKSGEASVIARISGARP